MDRAIFHGQERKRDRDGIKDKAGNGPGKSTVDAVILSSEEDSAAAHTTGSSPLWHRRDIMNQVTFVTGNLMHNGLEYESTKQLLKKYAENTKLK